MKRFLIISFILSCFLIGCSAESEEDAKLITNKEYHKIEKGMSYEEIVEIVGGEGKADSKESDSTVHYIWDGKAPDSFASITFNQDKVIRKFEKGIASR
ncbi:hypothetical protein [Pontibacillus marinus]|uniref:DUF3862 domain-containing protein n=1 Tax=Pontibacillus marinus BH030004 = DSM 16465 TaxID=1385511 RepID=A0A0A5I162_9BACI|nr:hypothetical protein [Pontibacillus marinus]KGX89597.1 hypothetical protein N783_05655 [Pontibacillus marinus BH030004 = DSM 16465]